MLHVACGLGPPSDRVLERASILTTLPGQPPIEGFGIQRKAGLQYGM